MCGESPYGDRTPFYLRALTGAKSTIDDIVIAVMGVTGAGKTTFIKTVTGFDETVVAPAETGCRAYRFHDGGLSFCLVDTPGLDATFMDDGAALDGISGFLADSYRAGALLSGVVYLHPIHDEKFEGLAEDNLALFQTLCGEGFFPHVVLATGFWSAADPSDAVRRETQLLGSPVLWREMLARGSTAVRLSESRDDRVALLRWMAAKGRQVTRLQHELVVEGRAVADTGAAASTARLRALRTRMQAYLRQAEGPRDESTRAPVPLPQQEMAAGEVAVVQPPQPHPPQSQPAAVVEWRQEHDEARPLEGERRRLARQAFRADVSGQHGQAVALISSGFWTGVTATNISMAVHDLGIPLCDICHHSCTVKVAYSASDRPQLPGLVPCVLGLWLTSPPLRSLQRVRRLWHLLPLLRPGPPMSQRGTRLLRPPQFRRHQGRPVFAAEKPGSRQASDTVQQVRQDHTRLLPA